MLLLLIKLLVELFSDYVISLGVQLLDSNVHLAKQLSSLLIVIGLVQLGAFVNDYDLGMDEGTLVHEKPTKQHRLHFFLGILNEIVEKLIVKM